MSAPEDGHTSVDGPVHEAAPVLEPLTAGQLARWDGIEKKYQERLANQRQVIENLSEARQLLLAANAKYESFARYVAALDEPQYAALAFKAQELLNAQEEA